MVDPLTRLVLEFQDGKIPLGVVRNKILEEVFSHLRRHGRKGEDEVSEFLLKFHEKIPGVLARFRPQGLPFRHFLLRTLRWQWNTFRSECSRERRQAWLATDTGVGWPEGECLAEPSSPPWDPGQVPPLNPSSVKRLVLLILKASPFLEEGHLEALSAHTGTELAWLQACQRRLKETTEQRRGRRELVTLKRSEAYYKRLMAEDDARREVDPIRRQIHERRAVRYRRRLSNLSREQVAISSAPTHRELAHLLGVPKGTVDSSLHHLKKELSRVYNGDHDHPSGDQQRPQETRI